MAWCEKTGFALPSRPAPVSCFTRRAFRAALLAGTALVSVASAVTAARAGDLASLALPTGGQVTAGQAAISQNGAAMTVTQSSPKAILTWQGFDIGKQASVTFNQPDASSMALNRVVAGNASRIEGQLSANGQVILVNPNGVVFGAGATVNVGGLVASALDIADADFLTGNLAFQRGGATGAVVNHGTITAGYAALLGSQLANDGLIEATLSTVALASGEAVVLSLSGNNLVGVAVQPSTVAALIQAGGITRADNGGKVLVTAAAANAVLGGAINADGVIAADSLTSKGGKVSLSAGGPITLSGAQITATGTTGGGAISIGDASTASVTVDAASRFNASATVQGSGGSLRVDSQNTAFHGRAAATGGAQGGDGGQVETSGARLDIASALVDVGAPHGKVGSWLLDPIDFVVDANAATAIDNGLANGDVTIRTTASGNTVTGAAASSGANPGCNGDIVVAAPISWTSGQALTLDAYHSVQVNAAVSGSGTNASGTNASGTGAGLVITTNDGGSGGSLSFGGGGSVTLPTSGRLMVGGHGYTLINNLQAVGSTGFYALASDIAAGSVTPIGLNDGSPINFTGTLEGLGHNITGLTINDSSHSNLGLFSVIGSGGVVRDLTLSGNVTAGSNVANVGLLAGTNRGVINNVGATARITFGSSVNGVGGLVGQNYGTILQSYALGSISGGYAAYNIGGLAGRNTNIGALIAQSFANTAITVGDNADFNAVPAAGVGGLVGAADFDLDATYPFVAGSPNALQGGSIVQSYAGGSIVAGNRASNIGGLVGVAGGFDSYGDTFGSVILTSYSTTSIRTGPWANAVGGLVGFGMPAMVQCYASGSIVVGAGSHYVGGLAGFVTDAKGTDAAYYNWTAPMPVSAGNFWDPAASGMTVGFGGNAGITMPVAVSGAAAYAQSTYTGAGWSFGNSAGGSGVWAMVDGYTRPMLAWEYSPVITNAHQLQLMSLAPSANYTLGSNIDLGTTANPSEVWNPTTGFVPIGFSTTGNNASPTPFTGTFDGQGHAITSLSMTFPGMNALGLFSSIGNGGSVRNLTLSGSVTDGSNGSNIGLLAGVNSGMVTNVSTSGNITVGNNASNVGGLVGDNNGGRVSASFASGSVSVGSGATGIGGLIGNNENGAIVQATYATGSVGAGSGSQNVGGLVGANDGTSSIDQSYATGLVAADATPTNVGGLVGSNSGSVTSSYWDMASTGQATSAAGTGLAVTDNWGTVGPQADTTWTSSGNWHFVDGKRYPLLAAFNGGARNPTPAPTVAPTPAPTAAPTPAPTVAPTPAPTDAPTPAPTVAPTPAPTEAPTPAPTVAPTPAPTDAPTPAPTDAPTPAPTDAPTPAPTVAPTPAPTVAPTPAPTVAPTVAPTPAPTTAPTPAPTPAPTAAPSPAPTVAPTPAPTVAPTPTDLTPALPTPGPTAPISPARPVIPVADAGADDPATQAIFAPLSATYEGQAETGEPRRELSMSQRNPAEATASRPTPETPTQCATDHGPSQTCSSVPAELRKVLGLAGNLGWIVQFNDESVAIPSGTPED